MTRGKLGTIFYSVSVSQLMNAASQPKIDGKTHLSLLFSKCFKVSENVHVLCLHTSFSSDCLVTELLMVIPKCVYISGFHRMIEGWKGCLRLPSPWSNGQLELVAQDRVQ